ncbi:hypothetical protein GIB67_009937 [Kingdonia uniflora]|uniref:Uncharacterized protein n=1 Tax=Kingdonia uniflora TaxID=39325 RepID=A0A7J7L494_9MAGN|nr:hypothetical protein GIB67_009937 [Kingdonia uniflora]
MQNASMLPAGPPKFRYPRIRESSTVTSIVQGPLSSHPLSSSHNGSQGATSLKTSSPSSTSQEMITSGDNSQEFKPILNVMSHSTCPLGSATANVSILNNLSQARQVMSSYLSN